MDDDGNRRKLLNDVDISWNWEWNESRNVEKVTGLSIVPVALVDKVDGESDDTCAEIVFKLAE